MSLQGLPDFQQPIRVEGLTIFYPYEGVGNYTMLPDRLDVADRSDGQPDFQLVLVRGQSLNLPPAPYGLLDFRLRPYYRLEDGLTQLRDRHPTATLAPAAFASSFLRLRPVNSGDSIPSELLAPIPLEWQNLETARFLMKLSTNAISVIKDSLQRGLLALYARVEMEMVGVAPRLPLRVRFNPAILLSSLRTVSKGAAQVTRDEVVHFFQNDLNTLPLEVIGDIDRLDRAEFAETVTDWVRSRFGTFVPSLEQHDGATLELMSPEQAGNGSVEWDLSEPRQSWRSVSLNLKPFEAAQQLVQNQGLSAVLQEATVPNIPTGMAQVAVSATVPTHRPGVFALGATLRVPPRIPFRPQPISVSTELNPPDDTASLLLRLSPTEKLEYTVSTFVVLEDGDGIIQLDGESFVHQGDRLKLYPHHFPVDFIPIEASQALLRIAAIHGVCRWQHNDAPAELQFELNAEQPAIALTLPQGTEDAVLTIEARSLDSSKTLCLNVLPAKRLWLDLFSFAEYGPQSIEVSCAFSENSAPLFAIDLLPEGKAEAPDAVTTLHFTSKQPLKPWSWFAASPFQNGYRYRPHVSDGEPLPWSNVCLPPDRLNLSAPLI